MGVHYPALIVLDRQANVIETRRLAGSGGGGIQPLILPGRDGELEMYLRPDSGMARKLYLSVSGDGGRNCSRPEPTHFDNPRSPACGVETPWHIQLIGMNEHPRNCEAITLYWRKSGARDWERIEWVSPGGSEGDELAYCTMVNGSDKTVHMVYSNKRGGKILHSVISLLDDANRSGQ